MNQENAINYIRRHGNPTDLAQLEWLLEQKRPSSTILDALFCHQRHDGGFAPPWAVDYSSIDTTCYFMDQGHKLGLDNAYPVLGKANRFLLQNQQNNGRFAESDNVASSAPPWANPHTPGADLYLTANAGFWLALASTTHEAAKESAAYLKRNLDPATGQLPSFLNTHWLAAGLFWLVADQETAVLLINHLQSRLPALSAANLAWLLDTLLTAGVPHDNALIQSATQKLAGMQEENGRFPSTEGQDIHTTLTALNVLRSF
ncbi:MAG: terpene cyclase/mutase family protein [Anaerolineae bacterium]|nr:terpene cyclase/mutase family protein [Anaerolineae bacterium]